MKNETVIVLDFGGQYKELIARRVRENNVYSLVKPGNITVEEIKEINPIGIILTGGPNSVYDEKSPKCDPEVFKLGIPVLGICYGHQLLCYTMGGKVHRIHFGGFRTRYKITRARFTAYRSLISLASSMISKAYFCLPCASSFL